MQHVVTIHKLCATVSRRFRAVSGSVSIITLFITLVLLGVGAYGCASKARDVGAASQETGELMESPKNPSDLVTISGKLASSSGKRLAPQYEHDGKTLKNAGAVVFLLEGPKTLRAPPAPKQAKRIICDNEGFHPSFDVVVIGQELLVVSEDNKTHNFLSSTPDGIEKAATSPPKEPQVLKRVFYKPFTLVSLTCGIHPKERATYTVSPSALYAYPDSLGNYSLKYSFVSGNYIIRAVSPTHGRIDKHVSIVDGTRINVVDFDFKDL